MRINFIMNAAAENDSKQADGCRKGYLRMCAISMYWSCDEVMSGATPTLIPRKPIFPLFLPEAPKPVPLSLPRRRVYRNLNAYRDFLREMDDLSNEENELDDEASILSLCY